MAILKTFDINGKLVQESNYDSNLFNLDKPNTQVIFDQVIAENAGVRQNSASTLTKSEVRGGGIKPRPQKHTGRARQGSIRNPQ
jgi:large subunit ribosomal protein L4